MRTRRRKVRLGVLVILITVILLALLAACGGQMGVMEAKSPAGPPDYWPQGEWRRSSPEAQGIDSAQLAKMLSWIEVSHRTVDSVAIVRHGTLVLEADHSPYTSDEPHLTFSVTKSVISTLIGIAIGQGQIEGVDVPVLSLYPDRQAANLDADKQAMTLEDVLTMSTGLECRDSYKYQWQGLTEMKSTDDWVGNFLSLPMAEPPGTRFEYCNGASYLLSDILYQTTGETPQEYARQHLFEPLGIEDVEWETSPEGISVGYTGLYLRPQDMAKLGYLYLHGGVWGGEQIVPAWYVEQATQKHIAADIEEGYGYQWWVDQGGMYVALGYHGQFIYVIPELDMVVVFLSDTSIGEFDSPYALLERFILPAVTADVALPENPDGLAELETNLEQLKEP